MSAGRFVLCVEDEPDIGLLLDRTLDKLPIDVVISKDGMAALEIIAERKPDLIVLDLMLPRLSGWEFLEQVRANDDWRDVPVIILSVRGGLEDRKRGRELKVARYMTKPFVPRRLQEIVIELLGLEDASA